MSFFGKGYRRGVQFAEAWLKDQQTAPKPLPVAKTPRARASTLQGFAYGIEHVIIRELAKKVK